MATTFESGLHAPFAGTVIAIAHEVGEPVAAGTALVILEAMKMEHEVIAERDGVVAKLEVEVGETVDEGQLLAVIAPATQRKPAPTAPPARPISEDDARTSNRSSRAMH